MAPEPNNQCRSHTSDPWPSDLHQAHFEFHTILWPWCPCQILLFPPTISDELNSFLWCKIIIQKKGGGKSQLMETPNYLISKIFQNVCNQPNRRGNRPSCAGRNSCPTEGGPGYGTAGPQVRSATLCGQERITAVCALPTAALLPKGTIPRWQGAQAPDSPWVAGVTSLDCDST